MGGVTLFSGFFRLLTSHLSFILLIPVFFLFFILKRCVVQVRYFSLFEKVLTAVLGAIWLLHFTGVFVPETGFDAVWYHLPVVEAFVKSGGYFYVPEYYQSLNPFFSDGIFLLGYEGLGEFGTKMVAYLFGISLMVVTYFLARKFLTRFWTLLLLITISVFQVISWQSSSFYVDIAKAVWELSALFFLLNTSHLTRKNIAVAGLFFGAALGTKLFSIILLPVFIVMIAVVLSGSQRKKHSMSSVFLFICASIIVALPFYLSAFFSTGNPFYAIELHTQKLEQIGGTSSLGEYLLQRTMLLPSSLTQLTLFSRDYTTLLLLIFAPLFLIFRKYIWQNKQLLVLSIFSIGQWIVWWYVPPLSTRYAVAGFITITIVLFICLQKYTSEKPAAQKYILLTVFLSLLFNMLPRGLVLKRNLEYITGMKSKTEYLQQFYDGSIDVNLKKWHKVQ